MLGFGWGLGVLTAGVVRSGVLSRVTILITHIKLGDL